MKIANYIIGYALSIAFTLTAAALLWYGVPLASGVLAIIFVALALIQLIVQLVYFLHVGQKDEPQANLAVFAFALIIVVILVGGTLWIMANLDHTTMLDKKYPAGVISPQNQRD